MTVIYWEVKDGALTGNYYKAWDEMEDGIYFIGYAFKVESDGYHLDGVMYEYTAEKDGVEIEPEPETSPVPGGEPEQSEGNDAEPTSTGGNGTEGELVIIEEEPVALAGAPIEAGLRVQSVQGAVLGARRIEASVSDAAVLGAQRGTEYAVLGKRRRPETGDSIALLMWSAALTVGAAAAVVSGTKLVCGRKSEK